MEECNFFRNQITNGSNLELFYLREKYTNLLKELNLEGKFIVGYISANSGFTKRVLDYVSFAFMAFWVGLFQKHDVVIATSPQFFTAWAGWGISKIRRKPWIFELRDIWPESIRAVGAMKHERVLGWLGKIELGLYKEADKVVAVTEAFKSNLIQRGIDLEKIEVVTNGSNIDLFYPVKKIMVYCNH